MENRQWYKDMVVYQIWTRSFCDGNGDGKGDLAGVMSKLDYIKSLGADAIWFSPLFPSPNADWGYDISDYMDIHPDFGDLALFKQLLSAAHERGLRVFMDLVVNHTSDEHEWFKKSREAVSSPYRDYYFWRKGKGNGGKRPPNNWTSLFEGSAWEYDTRTEEYYLHLFAKKQPDLNMDNPAVREEVKKIMRFWLDMGVDGFREDVITFISKTPGLPDCYPPLPIANGLKHFVNRPPVYDYLSEFKRDVLDNYDCFTVGESPMTEPRTALRYITEGPGQVLNEMIAFSHMEADCLMTDILMTRFNLKKMKKAFSDWQTMLAGKAWNCLYIENHDHARIVNRYGSLKYHKESAKLLAAMYMLLSGTPFIYQGQELGMTNIGLNELSEYKDVQTHNNARVFGHILPKKTVMELTRKTSRENARTPVQWTDEEYAGFSSTEPWFPVNPDYTRINARSEEADPDSILNFYKKLIAFRKSSDAVRFGDYLELMPESSKIYAYERRTEKQLLLVVCNFGDGLTRFDAPVGIKLYKGKLVLSNYDQNFIIANGFTCRPYELRVYLFEKES